MNDSRAFSLVELLVSVGIISLISAVVFFNYPQFNESTALNRSARELTLAFREAQTRAIAVAPLPDGTFPKNYGVYINGTPTEDGNGVFVIFSDANDNLKYDSGTDPLVDRDPLIKRVTFTRGIKITGFNASNKHTKFAGMHFIYYRPGPKVVVSDNEGDCISGKGQHNKCDSPSDYDDTLGSYGPFQIEISIPNSANSANKRTIEIWRTGQISIK